jgi:hypothetical protein
MVNSPQELKFTTVPGSTVLTGCETGNPYQHRFRMNGSVALRYGLQAAAVYQSLPGPNYDANYTFGNAQIQGLGRPLSGAVSAITVNLVPPLSQFFPRINQLDVRLSKIVVRRTGRVSSTSTSTTCRTAAPSSGSTAPMAELAVADLHARRAADQVRHTVRLLRCASERRSPSRRSYLCSRPGQPWRSTPGRASRSIDTPSGGRRMAHSNRHPPRSRKRRTATSGSEPIPDCCDSMAFAFSAGRPGRVRASSTRRLCRCSVRLTGRSGSGRTRGS